MLFAKRRPSALNTPCCARQYGWVRQFKAEANEAFRGNGKLTAQDEEIRRLRQQVADLTEERDILKKGNLVREAVAVRYAFIQEHLGQWKLRNRCRALHVSKSGFFAWCKRPPSERHKRDAEVRVRLLAFHKTSRGSYGSRRLMRDLRDAGEPCSRARVLCLMRGKHSREAAQAFSRYNAIGS